MTSILPFCIFLPMLSFKLALACLDGECRELSFPSFFFFADKHLVNHTIRIERVPDLDTCEFICYQEPNCVSINFNIKASADGTFSCELNNSTHRRHDDEFVDKLGYLYRGTESACDEDHCHNNALCQSGFTNKKYRCLCPSGFTGERCEIDINECATEEHSCSNDAVCHNTEGSHDCTCRPGYTGDGRNCTDINECEEGIHNCVTDDECINSNGSYRCTVPVAVALFPLNATYGTQEINNRTAQGIPNNVHMAPGPNEKPNGSYEFLGTWDSYIEFHNTAGGPLDVRESITMLCWLHHGDQNGPIFTYKTSGSSWGVHLFVYKGKLYVRFNKRDYSATKTETLLDTTPVAGGWKFVGASYDHVSGEAKLWVDGVVVQNKTVGAGLQLATQDSIRMGVKIGERDYFKGRITQMQVYNESLTQEQIQTIQRRTPRVVDINKCEKGTHNCSTDAFCSNTKESFNCTCKTGYVGDGRNCTDVNECEKGTHNCSTDAVCNNTKGSHNCTCKTGYAGDGHNCTDINECEKGTHDCSINAMCYNTNGSYECTCNPGYTGDGRNCTDINECENGNNCAGSNNCINLMGSYRCADTQNVYRLEVRTSSGRWSGTDAPVWIKIGGNKGLYQARLDTDPDKDYFESGNTDIFVLEANDVGTATQVWVYRGYYGWSPSWRLAYVSTS